MKNYQPLVYDDERWNRGEAVLGYYAEDTGRDIPTDETGEPDLEVVGELITDLLADLMQRYDTVTIEMAWEEALQKLDAVAP
jgi:hypothetical protein